MADVGTVYALINATRQALARQDCGGAIKLAAMLIQRWPDLLEAHHLLGVATYYTALGGGGPIEVPDAHAGLTTVSGNLHLQFAVAFEKAGQRALAEKAYCTAALLDFHLQPALRAGFGGPFNGQVLRAATFRAIAAHALTEVVETGAYRGTTTEFMAQHVTCPVQTTEVHPYFFEVTRLRIEEARRLGGAWAQRLQLAPLDSIAFLTDLFRVAPSRDTLAFFYLDAHGDYIEQSRPTLPLLEELALIRAARPHAIVMVDDVNVPDDPAYCAEDNIVMADIEPALPGFDAWFFPLSSRHDTGAMRGSVVLSGSADTTALLDGVAQLRRAGGRGHR